MKKLFFIAIALIAFSGVSMATTILDLPSKGKSNLEYLKAVYISNSTVDVDGCAGVWSSVSNYARSQGFSAEVAACMATAALEACSGTDAVIKSKGNKKC